MEVFVIMGNDFPYAVMADFDRAVFVCDQLNNLDKEEVKKAREKRHYLSRIYYNIFRFEIDKVIEPSRPRLV